MRGLLPWTFFKGLVVPCWWSTHWVLVRDIYAVEPKILTASNMFQIQWLSHRHTATWESLPGICSARDMVRNMAVVWEPFVLFSWVSWRALTFFICFCACVLKIAFASQIHVLHKINKHSGLVSAKIQLTFPALVSVVSGFSTLCEGRVFP